jgi:hypothetical protein
MQNGEGGCVRINLTRVDMTNHGGKKQSVSLMISLGTAREGRGVPLGTGTKSAAHSLKAAMYLRNRRRNGLSAAPGYVSTRVPETSIWTIA